MPTPMPTPATSTSRANLTVLGLTYSDPHDLAVMKRINGYIELANLKLPQGTVAERLEYAWSENIKQRELSAAESVDTVGRDADCYLAARKSLAVYKSPVTKELLREAGDEIAMPLYTATKYFQEAWVWAGRNPFLQSAPDRSAPGKMLPNAPPGGGIWERRGSRDGMLDNGQDVKPVVGHAFRPDEPPPA